MKGLYWMTGSIIAAQLIYGFNQEVGWLYAVYFVTNLILTDLFVFDYRIQGLEASVLLNYIFLASAIATGYISTSQMAAIALIPAGLYNVWLSYRAYKVFQSPDKWHLISSRNREIVEKKSAFMTVFFALVAGISLLGLFTGLMK